LLLLLAVAMLVVFVSWDGDRMAARAKRAADLRPSGTGVTPRTLITVPSLFAAGGALGAIAVVLVIKPQVPPFAGRGSWFLELLHAALGPYGPAMVALALSLACVFGAVMCMKQRVA